LTPLIGYITSFPACKIWIKTNNSNGNDKLRGKIADQNNIGMVGEKARNENTHP
jgi:hypothetical protein